MEKDFIAVAAGRKKAELVLKNAKIVDVFCRRIITGDVAIHQEKIAGIGDYTGETERDVCGAYVMPSLIESHAHIESAMLPPREYAKLVIPHGVTAMVADPHEIANVCGEAGLNFMLKDAENLPLEIYFMLPSCVPATPFEHAGAVIDGVTTQKFMESGNFYGLAEMMNVPGVVGADEDVLRKLSSTSRIDGHAPAVSGKELAAYISAGIFTDHECLSSENMLEKISMGMWILLREGTQAKNLVDLVPALTPTAMQRCALCTDDCHLGDIAQKGTVRNAVQTAIALGVEPIDAIIMATRNAAECYGFAHLGAVAPGKQADLLIADDLNLTHISAVYKNGALVAQDGKIVPQAFNAASNQIPAEVLNTVHIRKITPQDLNMEFDPAIPVIHWIEDTISTTAVYRDNADGLNRAAVIERHSGQTRIGKGFLDNYGIRGGAIAQTIGHDSHNITVVGDNTEDMALAVNTLGTQGGIAVVQAGKITAYLALPIAGLMSDKDAESTLTELHKVENAARELSVNPRIDPMMSLAFVSLPVIPELRLTDSGLFDVNKFEFIK
uniref:Adenine deaminase n=1 Tax=uncultured Bacillota bacterium TaxID=344338 RepID=A0A650EP54_9FIRM|nr:adenine deaminase [uncultured Firmicutes bacterium]